MRQSIYKKTITIISILFMTILLGIAGTLYYVNANDENSDIDPVALSEINYNDMTLTIYPNGNTIVYYSSDRKKWVEADGVLGTDANNKQTLTYDISWISAAGNTKLYYRGNKQTATAAITIPGYNKSFKVKFDKTTGEFDISNEEKATVARWRKTTDYTWHYFMIKRSEVSKGDGSSVETAQSLAEFESTVDKFRVKGTKLIIQTAPVAWSEQNEGLRPSKEVKITIPAKKAAPNVRINVKKMTINTTIKQEYTNELKDDIDNSGWKTCTRTMSIAELASSNDVTLHFRTSATSSASASKITTLSIPAREAAPSNPASLVQTPGKKAGAGKAEVTFDNVPAGGYEYYVAKTGTLTDEAKVTWRKVAKARKIKFTERSLPKGATIYIRKAGVTENIRKNIKLALPSHYVTISVGDYGVATTS